MKHLGRRFLYLAAFLWGATLLSPAVAPAWAEVNGNCQATFKGVDIAGLSSSSAGDAIDVDDNETVGVTFTSPVGFTSHDIKLEIAGISRSVASDTDDGDTQWSETVNVNDYAWAGAGLYKVSGSATLSDGSSCSGAALINVTANPLTTVAGGAAAAATVVGGAGVLGSSAVAARNGARGSRKVEDWIVDEIEKAGSSNEPPQQQQLSEEQAWIETVDLFFGPFYPGRIPCSILILPALVLTVGAMATPGGGSMPSAPKGLHLRRIGWRPRITAAGVLGGFLAGVGIVVLLQQYAVTPLTGTMAIVGIVGGLALGLILPSLVHLWSVMRVNSSIARGEQRLGAAIGKGGSAPEAQP